MEIFLFRVKTISQLKIQINLKLFSKTLVRVINFKISKIFQLLTKEILFKTQILKKYLIRI